MTKDEIAALIPANVVEAAAIEAAGLRSHNRDEFYKLTEHIRNHILKEARASLAAGLAAWGGMQRVDSDLTIGMAPFVALPIEEPKA